MQLVFLNKNLDIRNKITARTDVIRHVVFSHCKNQSLY